MHLRVTNVQPAIWETYCILVALLKVHRYAEIFSAVGVHLKAITSGSTGENHIFSYLSEMNDIQMGQQGFAF